MTLLQRPDRLTHPRPTRRGLLAASVGLAAGLAAGGGPVAAQTALNPSWSQAETLSLWPNGAPGAAEFKPQLLPPFWSQDLMRNIAAPYLKVFRPALANGRAVLIAPGGGYLYVSARHEGQAVAERLTALGYTVFVLCYRLPAEGWSARPDIPLQDAQRAIRLIKARAAPEAYGGERVAVLGFSAGGHLAASLATGYAEALVASGDAVDRLDARPAAAGLIYPVITMTRPYGHARSRDQLLGPAPSDALIAHRSVELRVTADTPPTFVCHAFDDKVVAPQNAQMMVTALRAAGRPVELHALQEGGHAFGVGQAGAATGQWISAFDIWLRRNLT